MKSSIKKGWFVRIKESCFEGNNYIGNSSHVYRSSIGFASYCGTNCSLIRIKIGKYCSLGSCVKVVFGNHPTSKWVSTHPAFYSPTNVTRISFTNCNRFDEYTYADDRNEYYVTVGSDVWIGTDVKLLSGVDIGDGAIIASGAVVTSNIPPYAIVGGCRLK